MTIKEIWKEIDGYNGLYEISNLGRIKSYCKGRWGKRKNGKILKCSRPSKNREYFQVDLKGKRYLVHRLVAIHFISNNMNYDQVNHIDGNKQNNIYTNLEWCNNQYNVQHYFNNNPNTIPKGKDHHRSISILQFDKNYNFIKEWGCIFDVERQLGIKHNSISNCLANKTKTSGGFIWKYKNNKIAC